MISLFSFQTPAKAQNTITNEQKDSNIMVVGVPKTLKVSGKVAFFLVKETAKIAWETTKFTAKEMAAPVAKAILVKAAPQVSLFLLKQSGNILQKAAPIALKAAITYLKL